MRTEKSRRILVYIATAGVVWLVLALYRWIGIPPSGWLWWGAGQFFGLMSIAIATAAIGSLSDTLTVGMRGFASRTGFALLTALAVSVVYGFFAWVSSFLPTAVRITLGVSGFVLGLMIWFSAAIAAARKTPPLQAIQASARFVLSKPGIKLCLLIGLIGGAPAGIAAGLGNQFSGLQPETGRLLIALIGTTGATAGSLVAGVAIWRRFGGGQTESRATERPQTTKSGKQWRSGRRTTKRIG